MTSDWTEDIWKKMKESKGVITLEKDEKEIMLFNKGFFVKCRAGDLRNEN